MVIPEKIKTAVSPENIIYNLEFEDALKGNNLLDFDRVMSIGETRIVKHAIPERRTGTFSFEQEGKTVCAYLKRHYPLSFGKYFQEMIRFASKKTAFDEFNNILAFHQAGLPTMIPVVAGKRADKVFGSESFLITKGIKDCVTLETYAESCLKTKTFTEKTELIKKTALLSRKMHQSGFNHRDFYLCHLLIGTEENNKDELFVVDLHRVDIRKKVPERWIIKDLAALNYSAKSKNITRTDKLRFLKYYLSTGKISEQDKLFILKIIKKTNRMIKHAR
jgi:heptose I phosphotransferase